MELEARAIAAYNRLPTAALNPVAEGQGSNAVMQQSQGLNVLIDQLSSQIAPHNVYQLGT